MQKASLKSDLLRFAMNYHDIVRIHKILDEANKSLGLSQALLEQANEACSRAEDFLSIAKSILSGIRPN